MTPLRGWACPFSTIWRLIRSGQLRAVKILGRTLVPESELQRLAQPPSE
jgi:hypothetical protein